MRKRPQRFLLIPLLSLTSFALGADFIMQIEGVEDEEMRKNAHNAALISIHHKKEAPDKLRLDWLHQRAVEEIENSFIPFGYYKAHVTPSLTFIDDTWHATYSVTLNEPNRVKKLNLGLIGDGAEYRPLKRAIRTSKLKEGAILDHELYELTKADLLETSQERGYFDAQFTQHEILVDLIQNSSDINLILDTGERYRFGNVTFNQEYFDDKLLNRLITFHDNSYYSDDDISEFQSQLSASNYFNNIVITPRIDPETKSVPLDLYLQRREQRTLTGGIGYSTDIRFRALAGMNWHYINRRGHKLLTDLMYGQRKRDGIIRYTIPGHDPVKDSHHLFLRYDYEDTRDKDYSTFAIGAAVEKERRLWSFGYSLEYQYDRFQDLNGVKQKSKALMPSIYAEWKSRDRVRFGRSGFKLFAKLRGADRSLGSDISFLQAHLKAHYIMPLGSDNRFIIRGELGHTYMREGDLNRLPPSIRFYTGGDHTVRGYSYDSIGEHDYRGRVAGGKRLAVISGEFEHRVSKDFAGALFVDAGDAYNGSRPSFKVGAGAGIRWYSPIGAVRFDIAHGFHKSGDTVRLHLTIGTDL